ncbi:MAG: 4Fe-4S dicluster domain-containing protein [Candidatus Binatia bacterium]
MARANKDTDFQVHAELCVGCQYCELACSFVKFEVYDRSRSYIVVSRHHESKVPETYKVVFTADCDSCGVCLEYCYFGAIVNLKHPKLLPPLPEPKLSRTLTEQ